MQTRINHFLFLAFLALSFCSTVTLGTPMGNFSDFVDAEADAEMSDRKVLGVIVIARNGDRTEYYQDPMTYQGHNTESTALGVAESHQLGSLLRSIYLDPSSSDYIDGMRSDIVDNEEIKVRVKNGGEGTVIFDSAIALLQGLFPPNPKNRIELANETTVMAPLNGYQYVPVETVEPINDRSLESWTDCPAFEKHTREFYASEEFQKKESEAAPFFRAVKDFVFGRPTTLENAYNIFDFINSQLTHNKTYAHRLPPNLIEQARALANFHENGIFSDKQTSGIGNIAGRTMLHTILRSLERVAFNDDPLQFMLIETGYQPFISFFNEVGVVKEHPELKAIPDYTSALAIELRRGSPPDLRDFLRFKFKNGTSGFKTIYVYGHHADIALTEFIYKSKGGVISSNKQWAEVCGRRRSSFVEDLSFAARNQSAFSIAFAFAALIGLVVLLRLVRSTRQKIRNARRVRLEGQEQMLNVSTAEPEKIRAV